jgi:hypothetical protein
MVVESDIDVRIFCLLVIQVVQNVLMLELIVRINLTLSKLLVVDLLHSDFLSIVVSQVDISIIVRRSN